MIIGYSRVSSSKQDIEKYNFFFHNYEKISGEKIDNLVFEKISATKTSIKERKIWDLIQDKNIEKIIVPSISRLGRSVPDSVDLLREIKNYRSNLKIYIVNKNITIKKDMSPGDEYHFYDLINSAGKEIINRVEFIKLGIERARKQGKTIGRPKKSKLDQFKKEILACKAIGISNADIARAKNVNQSTLYRWLKKIEYDVN